MKPLHGPNSKCWKPLTCTLWVLERHWPMLLFLHS